MKFTVKTIVAFGATPLLAGVIAFGFQNCGRFVTPNTRLELTSDFKFRGSCPWLPTEEWDAPEFSLGMQQ